jgi:diguanylate cyclase (GGDEF)-like protein/PAS domain S-box-containing protein
MPFKYRIAVTIFALEVIVIGAVLWITLGHSLSTVRQQIAHTEEVTIQLIGDLSRVALLTDEFADLQAFIERARRDPRITAVTVGDVHGRIVAATDVASIGRPLPRFVDGEDRYWRHLEVRGRTSSLGTLAIEFSDYPLLLAHRDTRNLGMTVAIGGMLLIAVVGLAMGFVLTRRLGALARAADQVAAGDLSLRIAAPGRDEVARLGRAFNSMVARLADNLAALRVARDRLILPTEAMSEGFALWDPEDRLVLYNSRFRELFDAFDEEIQLGARFEHLCRLAWDRLLNEEGRPSFESYVDGRLAHHRCPRGHWEAQWRDGRWLAVSESRTRDGGTVTIYTDITEMKRRERALELGEQRLRAIMDAVIDGILTVTESGRVESCNSAAARIFGEARSGLVGRPIVELLGPPPGDVAAGAGTFDLRRQPTNRLLEVVGRRPGGSTFPIELSVTDLERWGGRTYILTVRDITQRKAAEEQIVFHATHDTLTKLPNRFLFDDRLGAALEQAKRRDEMLAVLFLDLDRFKLINDSLGHSVGDALLVALSRRLRAAVRSEDTVARMGGDEFILILRGVRGAEDAVRPARKIVDAIRPPFQVRGHELHVSASIGISLYPADGLGADQLLKAADMALYRAKEGGRNRIQLYNPAFNVRVFEQLLLEKQLRRALGTDQLSVVYQPQVALDSGRMVGFEALARWHHPELGEVAPSEFVPLAEECGLIEQLDLFVLRTACLEHRRWRRARGPVRLAVNLSARELESPGLDDRILAVLDETGMDPCWLELELTERALMQEGDATAQMLARLHGFGIGLALDDFGTGYSSLSCLERFPIERVKIDRAFVRKIHTAESDTALTRAVVAMAHSLGLKVLAEGIETPKQLAVLQRHGCDEGQGHLLGRPVPATDVPRILLARPGPAPLEEVRTARAS